MTSINILKEIEGNNLIKERLEKKEIFFVGRSGVTECDIVCTMLLDNKRCSDQTVRNARSPAGIYPNDHDYLYAFSKKYSDCIKSLDLVAFIGCTPNYSRLITNYCPNAIPFYLWGLEPYHFPQNPWSEALKDKRVLVIHPFQKSIEQNYKNRQHLFVGTNILPEFELITMKAIQNIGNNMNYDWFDSLYTMQDEINNIDFDVALIGCGAFGLPLGAHIKKHLNKTAIHMGGALQLLFGIMGNRWAQYNRHGSKNFINEYWTRPLPEETPEGYKNAEQGCYW
jgi:hypothetical protein